MSGPGKSLAACFAILIIVFALIGCRLNPFGKFDDADDPVPGATTTSVAAEKFLMAITVSGDDAGMKFSTSFRNDASPRTEPSKVGRDGLGAPSSIATGGAQISSAPTTAIFTQLSVTQNNLRLKIQPMKNGKACKGIVKRFAGNGFKKSRSEPVLDFPDFR